MRLVWIMGLVLLALTSPARAAEPTAWFIIATDGGDVLGHASERVSTAPEGRQVIDEQVLLVSDRGSPPLRLVTRTVTIEDGAGRPMTIETLTRQGRRQSRILAHFSADQVEITRQVGADVHRRVIPIDATVRLDNGQGLLRSWNPVTTPELRYRALNIDAMAVETVVVAPIPDQGGADGQRQVLRLTYDGDQLRAVARLTLDREGRIATITQPMFGTVVQIRATDEATALGAYRPFPLLNRSLIKSPFRIPGAAASGRIRYRFSFRDSIAFPLPATPDQRVTASADGVTLDICQDCGPGLPSDPGYLADARRPTAWLQSDHPKVLAIARPVAGLKVSDRRKMELLLARARPILARTDFAGHYSALETIERRSGDCTEAAMLLAALGRAAGIPTRVVNGLVYSREKYHGVSNVFMPHSWTLAYVDGQWRSFDLALGDFDATHIALSIGDGDARSVATASQLASLLQWKEMTQVRSRPAP